MPIVNDYYDDATLRRAVLIERLKAGQRSDYDQMLAVVIPALYAIMARYGVDHISELSTRQLTKLLSDLSKELDRASSDFIKRMMTWLKQFTRDQNDWQTELMDRTVDPIGAKLPSVSYKYTDELVFSALVGTTGMDIKKSLEVMLATQKAQLSKRIRMAAAQNMKMTDTIKTIIGTKTAAYKDGLMGSLRNLGHEMVGSVIQFAANTTNLAFMDKFQDYVTGYMWVSVLDGKTSGICRSLDGRTFGFGEGPIPPAHPNCRSHITAVFRNNVNFLKGLTRKTVSGSIDASVTYYTWLKKQSAAFQDSAIGKTRGKLFRNGGVSAEEFARLNVGRNFEQLTLDELRDLRPEMFDAARIH